LSSNAHTPADAAPTTATTAAPTPQANWVLATTILASSLAFIDGSVVNVALSAVGVSLHVGASDLQWLINAYLLPLGALLLLGGAAGDRFGRKRVLVIGTAAFTLASLECALAPGLAWLLAGRALQGVGAALLMPNSLAILGASFSGAARGRAIGIWAAMGAVMAAVGPVLGGYLIDHHGWRSIFFINLPIALSAIVLALRFVTDEPASEGAPRLDLLGAGLATAGLAALTWGLTAGAGSAGWTRSALGSCLLALLLLMAFLSIEHHRGERAMMPLAVFGSRSFVGLSLLTLLLYGALGALLVALPYLLIRVGGYTAVQAGAALLPLAVVLSVASPMMGALAARIGARWTLSAGPVVTGAGFLLLRRVGSDTGYWLSVFPALTVMALGMSGAVAPLTTAVLSSVDRRHTGLASGLNSAIARNAGMLATASLGAVLGASGAALIGGFHIVCWACAAASLGAGASAWLLLPQRAAQ